MKVNCVYFRDWSGQPNWCICHWEECHPEGCRDYEQVLERYPVSKEESK